MVVKNVQVIMAYGQQVYKNKKESGKIVQSIWYETQ